jgi:hypothetical protein
MSFIKDFLTTYNDITVDNPITLQKDDCKLINTKKKDYYIHTYKPINFDVLKTKLGISEAVLSRFNNEPRQNCCNAISITLYFNECYERNMEKYLNSIYGTVKIVHKNLKDWLVRVYLDSSVYKCIEEIKQKLNDSSITESIRKSNMTILNSFNTIINSPNVEIYTFICESNIIIEKKRTLRYLILIDPEVNISAIREADGYLNNLECHNLKMFANSQDVLFYLPPIIGNNMMPISNDGDIVKYWSYSGWLSYYKYIFQTEYFKTHQNVYDLLAGLFTTKLKIKPEHYYKNIGDLNETFNKFKKLSHDEKIETYKDFNQILLIIVNAKKPKVYKSLHEVFRANSTDNFQNLYKTLDVGFDEILLLEIFKEIISIPIIQNGDTINVDKEIFKTTKSLFYAFDIKKIEASFKKELIDKLKIEEIIEPIFELDDKSDNLDIQDIIFIDAIILKNIKCNFPFSIVYNKENILDVLNQQYYVNYDKYYDDTYQAIGGYMNKYLKYKNKYLELKKSIN